VPPATNIEAQVELADTLSADEARRVEVVTVLEEPVVRRDRGVVALGVVPRHEGDEGRRVSDEAILEVLTHFGGWHNLTAGLPGLDFVGLPTLVRDEVPLGEVAIEIRQAELLLGELDEPGGRGSRNRDTVAGLAARNAATVGRAGLHAGLRLRIEPVRVDELDDLPDRCLTLIGAQTLESLERHVEGGCELLQCRREREQPTEDPHDQRKILLLFCHDFTISHGLTPYPNSMSGLQAYPTHELCRKAACEGTEKRSTKTRFCQYIMILSTYGNRAKLSTK